MKSCNHHIRTLLWSVLASVAFAGPSYAESFVITGHYTWEPEFDDTRQLSFAIDGVKPSGPRERSDGGGGAADPGSDNNSNEDECSSSKPVVIATGEKWKRETDFTTGGLYPLDLTRTYRSINSTGGLFGSKWTSSIDYPKLSYTFAGCTTTPLGHCIPQTVTHIGSDGTKYTYSYDGWTDDGSVYSYSVRGAELTGRLVWNYGKRWFLTRDKTSYSYTNAGAIASINDYAGLITTFTYTGTTLTAVSRAGRTSQSDLDQWESDKGTRPERFVLDLCVRCQRHAQYSNAARSRRSDPQIRI